jgi:uncharacterized membrane protein
MKSLRSISSSRHASTLDRAALWLILLLAFALRVYRLGAQAIWWDESLSLHRATRDLGTVLANTILIQNVVTTDTLPQCYFIFLHFLVRAFGTSEFALRFFSVIANIATIPLVYALARRWLGHAAALIAALLGALSPFYVWYAQEARPYALVLFWSTLAVYALTRAFSPVIARSVPSASSGQALSGAAFFPGTAHQGRCAAKSKDRDEATPKLLGDCFAESTLSEANVLAMPNGCWIFAYLLAAIAALYTHYFAIFLFPFHAILILIFVWQRSIWRARAWIFLPALPFVSVIFLFRQVLASAASNVGTGPSFVAPEVILRDLLNSFSIGITMDWALGAWFDLAMLVLFLIGIGFPTSNFQFPASKSRFTLILLAYISIPIAGVLVLSSARPLYQNSRYLIAISPAFYLGVAAGIAALARGWRPLALAALGVFVIGAVLSLNNWYFDPRFGKDDHRAWVESLRERARPGDFLILNSPHAEELYRYYADDILPIATLPILRADGKPSPDADLTVVRDAYRNNARVWYLAMDVPFDDPDRRIEKLLQQEGILLDHAQFAGTSTEIALSLFVRALPMADARDIRYPLDHAFDGHLRLRGYDAPASIAPGARGIVKLYWQIDEPVGEDYAVSLRLIDEAGTGVGQWDATPLGNRSGSSTWESQKIIVDARAVRITVGTPPGKFRLQVVPYHSATGTALGEVVTFGEIYVAGN